LEPLSFQYPASVSLILTLILLCLQLHFIKPYFLVNDDIFKIFLAKGIGIGSTPTPNFILSNILLGLFFVKWFAWFPAFPWYGWFLCATQFLSMWAFLWVLFQRQARGFHLLLFIVSCLGVQFIFFTYLQFTMTASMAAGAGSLLFLFSLEPNLGRRRIHAWIFSGTLLLFSWLIRPDSFLLVLLASAPLALFKIRQLSLRKIIRQQWKFVSAVALVVFLAAGIDFAWFQAHEDWKDFYQFARGLKNFLEFHPSDYSAKTKPLFDSVGWSENDYWLFRNWYLMDANKYSLSNFEKLKAQFPRIGSAGKTGSFQSPMDLFASFWDLRIFLYFFVFWVFCRGKAFRFLFGQLAWIVLLLIFLIYFLKATDRVTLPLLAYLMNLAIYYAEKPFLREGKKSFTLGYFLRWAPFIPLCAALVFVFPNLENYYFQNQAKQKVESQMKICLKQLHPTDQQLFIMWEFPFELINAFDDFECLRPIRMFTTSTMQRCPATRETLEKFKIKNVFRDAVDNPNIFMICNQEEGLHYHKYLEENYHIGVYAQKVFDCGYFRAFSIHSLKGS
jgi:hypothetical protein